MFGFQGGLKRSLDNKEKRLKTSHADGLPPYDLVSKNLLTPLQGQISDEAHDVSEDLYKHIGESPAFARILSNLSDDEFAHLNKKQTAHLIMLLSDGLTKEVHDRAARLAGKAYMLLGLDLLSLMGIYEYYEKKIQHVVNDHMEDPEDRELLIETIHQRIHLDIEEQVKYYIEANAEINAAFQKLAKRVMPTDNLGESVRGALKVISDLPGGVLALFSRVDEAGDLQIEQTCGIAAKQYLQAIESGATHKISIDPQSPYGRGPAGCAWRSGEIVTIDAWRRAGKTVQPWKKLWTALGISSIAAIPLLDTAGRTTALIYLYSAWPGYFSVEAISSFLTNAQQVMSHALGPLMFTPVIPFQDQIYYRQMLREGNIQILYQPIISLRDGTLVKAEALARLIGTESEVIPPNRFLPTLSQQEFLRLFELGLTQACKDYHFFSSHGIDPVITINFPVAVADDSRCKSMVFEILDEHNMPYDKLQLEIMETKDSPDVGVNKSDFFEAMNHSGIQIVEDDLGSGHSSLLRLDQDPFSEVKIDQGLVSGRISDPKRVVEFIHYLTRLAHAVDLRVTVEGLENDGLIEAAAILGAEYGQGYAISKPIAPAEIIAWNKTFKYPCDSTNPRTNLGAIAASYGA